MAVAVGEVQDHGDGTYSCSYSYTAAGAYELHVTNGRQTKALLLVCTACTAQLVLRGLHCLYCSTAQLGVCDCVCVSSLPMSAV